MSNVFVHKEPHGFGFCWVEDEITGAVIPCDGTYHDDGMSGTKPAPEYDEGVIDSIIEYKRQEDDMRKMTQEQEDAIRESLGYSVENRQSDVSAQLLQDEIDKIGQSQNEESWN